MGGQCSLSIFTSLPSTEHIETMFDFASERHPDTICYLTHGTMGHLDPLQPPTRRKPYAALLALPFVHKVEFILPRELYEIMKNDISAKLPDPVYSRVIMPLSALLQGDFFNEYIKKGNILMLSEGHRGIDNVFALKDGVLTMALERETYEKVGLVGKPDGVNGQRGNRPRWIVEINLRLPSMLHGKKGFDRILYAFKNVLPVPLTWLFIDLNVDASTANPIDSHFPVKSRCAFMATQSPTAQMPDLLPPSEARTEFEDSFTDHVVKMYEWLSLISLDSPRLDLRDSIDPFLSRYSPPTTQQPDNVDLIKLTWRGFMSASWAHKAFVEGLILARPDMWFSFFVSGFNESVSMGARDCTILKLPGTSNEYILWEIRRT